MQQCPFQLRVRYDKHANWATLQVTLQEDRLDELLAVAGAITNPHQPPAHGDGTDDSPPFAHAVPVPGATGTGKTTLLNILERHLFLTHWTTKLCLCATHDKLLQVRYGGYNRLPAHPRLSD